MSAKTKLLSAGIAGLTCGALAGGLALASSHPTLGTASNAALGKTIVVDRHGMTVYALRPETARHLLCTKASGCLSAWPPVTVKSRHAKVSAAHGIKGKLGIVHRDGVFQVTLDGHPLYRFGGDQAAGDAHGQGLHSFGGTWHVIAVKSGSSGATTTTTDTTTTQTTTGYTYPPPYR